MDNYIRPITQQCFWCNRGFARPRLTERQVGNKMITEGHWVCPCCSNTFKRGIVAERVIEDKKSDAK